MKSNYTTVEQHSQNNIDILIAFSYLDEITQLINHLDQAKNAPIAINTITIKLIGSRMSAKTRQTIKWLEQQLYIHQNLIIKETIWRLTPSSATETFEECIDVLENDLDMESNRSNTNASKRRIRYNKNTLTIRGLENGRKKSVKKLGTARGTKDVDIRVMEEITEFSGWKDIKLMEQSTGGAKLTINIHISNPWLISNFYVKDFNASLRFDEKTLKEKGQQFKSELKNGHLHIWHISNHRVNTYLADGQHQSLIDVWEIDTNMAKVVDLGMPGAAYGMIYGSEQNNIKEYTEQEASQFSYSYFFGGIDLGHNEHASTFALQGIRPNMEEVLLDEAYHNEQEQGILDEQSFIKTIVKKIIYWSRLIPRMKRDGLRLFVEHNSWFKNTLDNILVANKLHWVSTRFAIKAEVRERISARKYKLQTNRIAVVKGRGEHYRRELSLQVWSDTEKYADGTYKPVDADDHFTDAVDYSVCSIRNLIAKEDKFKLMNKWA